MLTIGSPIPDVTLKGPDGRDFPLRSLRGRETVLFFYPKDDSPICTKEACSFRDSYEDFLAMGAEVVGISDDDADSHRRFAQRWSLPFTLLTDEGGKARNAFGIGRFLGVLKGRATFVVDRDGIIRAVIDDRFRARAHVQQALESLRAQRAAKV
ncbi:MAG TPA: peroxiredoxin [Flavobacteriales bacterium]